MGMAWNKDFIIIIIIIRIIIITISVKFDNITCNNILKVPNTPRCTFFKRLLLYKL